MDIRNGLTLNPDSPMPADAPSDMIPGNGNDPGYNEDDLKTTLIGLRS